MSSHSDESSRADLARLALRQARAAAASRRSETSVQQPRKHAVKRVRADGREPTGLLGVLTQLVSGEGWQEPLSAGDVGAQWRQAVGELSDHVAFLRYDRTKGELHLRALSPAYATHVKLLAPQLLATLRSRPGLLGITALRVQGGTASPLSPSGVPPAPRPEVPGPRRPHPAGYLDAVAAARAARSCAPTNHLIATAVERQNRVHRKPSMREPEEDFARFLGAGRTGNTRAGGSARRASGPRLLGDPKRPTTTEG
ncbi:DciA family protein [Kitasatospora sp. NPDC088783]|uniref:DciA family protein n=1 Tax=Kitasatospora sp. NPDC088783 TaxID=3364077 RepID=UPI0038289C1D